MPSAGAAALRPRGAGPGLRGTALGDNRAHHPGRRCQGAVSRARSGPELLGALDPADLDRVDKAIYNAFGLPL
jgi:hypothetical protein